MPEFAFDGAPVNGSKPLPRPLFLIGSDAAGGFDTKSLTNHVSPFAKSCTSGTSVRDRQSSTNWNLAVYGGVPFFCRCRALINTHVPVFVSHFIVIVV